LELKSLQIKGQVLFKGEIITKCKNKVGSFKNLLLQNHGPILTRFGTNYPWG
jgi:hypothetical protein